MSEIKYLEDIGALQYQPATTDYYKYGPVEVLGLREHFNREIYDGIGVDNIFDLTRCSIGEVNAGTTNGLVSFRIRKAIQNIGLNIRPEDTEKFLYGYPEYLKEIAAAVSIPCLRKDFTVDDYMIFEAKCLGASAVLLICAILDKAQIKEYLSVCDSLGLSALVEAHDEAEVEMALDAGGRIIGVNNRNLKDFSVDTSNSRRLRSMIPSDKVFVSESGVSTAEDVAALRAAGVDAVLVGEALMRATDKNAKLAELRGTAMSS